MKKALNVCVVRITKDIVLQLIPREGCSEVFNAIQAQFVLILSSICCFQSETLGHQASMKIEMTQPSQITKEAEAFLFKKYKWFVICFFQTNRQNFSCRKESPWKITEFQFYFGRLWEWRNSVVWSYESSSKPNDVLTTKPLIHLMCQFCQRIRDGIPQKTQLIPGRMSEGSNVSKVIL